MCTEYECWESVLEYTSHHFFQKNIGELLQFCVHLRTQNQGVECALILTVGADYMCTLL